jgi:hypothetical protein
VKTSGDCYINGDGIARDKTQNNPATGWNSLPRTVWTKRRLSPSTTWLPVIAATALTPPEFNQIVYQDHFQLSPDGHGLAQV